jgi:molybdopterin converting factor small subunit
LQPCGYVVDLSIYIFKNLLKNEEIIMKVDLKCFSTLVDSETCDYKDSTPYNLAEGQTVEDLAQRAGIAKKNVKIVFVNSRIVDFDTTLSDGDRVGLAPAVGGM